MIIRAMKKDDRQEVFEMMKVFYHSDAVVVKASDEVLFKNIDNCIENHAYLDGFVFEEDAEILGYNMVAKSYSTEYGGMCYWIEDIYLKPKAQGKGYVKALFEFIERNYKETAVRFRLEVCKTNENAIKAYIKNGYKELGYMEMSKEI